MTSYSGPEEGLYNYSQAKHDPDCTMELNTWVANDFITADIPQLQYVISLTGLKIILPLCSLPSFLHNRIPYEHNTILNAWVADYLQPLDMVFLSIIHHMYSGTVCWRDNVWQKWMDKNLGKTV